MTNENVKILTTLSNTHRNQLNERRKYERKVFFTTLGIYTAVLGASFTGKIQHSITNSNNFKVLACYLTFLPALASSIYLTYLHKANKLNQDFAHAAENALMDSTRRQEFKRIRKDLPCFVKIYWSLIWQVFILFLIAVITLLILFTAGTI